jgi:hypothetical protein
MPDLILPPYRPDPVRWRGRPRLKVEGESLTRPLPGCPHAYGVASLLTTPRSKSASTPLSSMGSPAG